MSSKRTQIFSIVAAATALSTALIFNLGLENDNANENGQPAPQISNAPSVRINGNTIQIVTDKTFLNYKGHYYLAQFGGPTAILSIMPVTKQDIEASSRFSKIENGVRISGTSVVHPVEPDTELARMVELALKGEFAQPEAAPAAAVP